VNFLLKMNNVLKQVRAMEQCYFSFQMRSAPPQSSCTKSMSINFSWKCLTKVLLGQHHWWICLDSGKALHATKISISQWKTEHSSLTSATAWDTIYYSATKLKGFFLLEIYLFEELNNSLLPSRSNSLIRKLEKINSRVLFYSQISELFLK
jgi:hypothetical protein